MKKRLLLLISILCLAFACLFTACSDGGEDSSSGGGTQKLPTAPLGLTLDKTETSLLLGEETYLVAYYQAREGEQISFTSENDTVATVNAEGLITAQNIGETTITVTYGEQKAECKVKVISGGYLPSLHFNYLVGDEFSVSMVDKANLSAYVLFNGKRFEDVTLSYTFQEDLGEVKDGFFTPKNVGETELTVKASWRGFDGVSLVKKLKIKVITAFEFYVNEGKVEYKMHNREWVGTDYYGKPEMDFKVYCLENGVAVENVEIEITEGADILAYDATAQKLKVLDGKKGLALVTVKATDSKSVVHEMTIKVQIVASAPQESGYFDLLWLTPKETDDATSEGDFNPDWVTK